MFLGTASSDTPEGESPEGESNTITLAVWVIAGTLVGLFFLAFAGCAFFFLYIRPRSRVAHGETTRPVESPVPQATTTFQRQVYSHTVQWETWATSTSTEEANAVAGVSTRREYWEMRSLNARSEKHTGGVFVVHTHPGHSTLQIEPPSLGCCARKKRCHFHKDDVDLADLLRHANVHTVEPMFVDPGPVQTCNTGNGSDDTRRPS
ncbi:hypothetical protein Bbelb_163560 [Branchiostoma belcheri]|nr:hypothetical protein Bbelb_163560 [Branchiostoma belcheri]